jgi:FkbM family methyltransferase
MRITEGLEFYVLFKDIFYHRIYRFASRTPDPVIVDGGSHFGMAILYFKHLYPRARVIGFEANPKVFRILQENVKRNGLNDVTLINASLGAQADTRAFPGPVPNGDGTATEEGKILVQERPLSEFIQEPIDFLKLTLDGNELTVLQELATSGKLSQIREMVVEYTSRGPEEQRLGALLDLLTRHGFRYLIHDYDAETNLATKPPFRLQPTTIWYCLVYARQMT